jgi:hypothetical protein
MFYFYNSDFFNRAHLWYLCSEFFLLRVLPRLTQRDPALFKKFYPAAFYLFIGSNSGRVLNLSYELEFWSQRLKKGVEIEVLFWLLSLLKSVRYPKIKVLGLSRWFYCKRGGRFQHPLKTLKKLCSQSFFRILQIRRNSLNYKKILACTCVIRIFCKFNELSPLAT